MKVDELAFQRDIWYPREVSRRFFHLPAVLLSYHSFCKYRDLDFCILRRTQKISYLLEATDRLAATFQYLTRGFKGLILEPGKISGVIFVQQQWIICIIL